MALSYSGVPVSRDSVTVRQRDQYQDPETEAFYLSPVTKCLLWKRTETSEIDPDQRGNWMVHRVSTKCIFYLQVTFSLDALWS